MSQYMTNMTSEKDLSDIASTNNIGAHDSIRDEENHKQSEDKSSNKFSRFN